MCCDRTWRTSAIFSFWRRNERKEKEESPFRTRLFWICPWNFVLLPNFSPKSGNNTTMALVACQKRMKGNPNYHDRRDRSALRNVCDCQQRAVLFRDLERKKTTTRGLRGFVGWRLPQVGGITWRKVRGPTRRFRKAHRFSPEPRCFPYSVYRLLALS